MFIALENQGCCYGCKYEWKAIKQDSEEEYECNLLLVVQDNLDEQSHCENYHQTYQYRAHRIQRGSTKGNLFFSFQYKKYITVS